MGDFERCVIANGSMRTGSTLQYNLVRMILELEGVQLIEGSQKARPGYTLKMAESVEQMRELRKQTDDWILCKTHHYDETVNDFLDGGGIALIKYRDPRDIWHSLIKFELGHNVKSYTGRVRLCWKTYRDAPADQVIAYKYERYYGNPCAELGRIWGEMSKHLDSNLHDIGLIADEVFETWHPEAVRELSLSGADTGSLMITTRSGKGDGHVSASLGRPGEWRKAKIKKADMSWMRKYFRDYMRDLGYKL